MRSGPPRERLGATYLGDGRTRFSVWAPRAERVDLLLDGGWEVALERRDRGYFDVVAEGVEPGRRYRFRLDGGDALPDPASRSQPEDVHGPSAVVDTAFGWRDGEWRGLALEDLVIYEAHVGTATPEGTFDAMVDQLDDLRGLGVTALELMPVGQFPGWRNWGYDGVFPYAAQHSYGGADALKRLVDACHERGMAVVLDVVYNHLGPEGNHLPAFGPYFTDRYATPWGDAINFDGAGSDEVRRYFLNNAAEWLEDFHVDALRLDAIHGIVDVSSHPFLEELAGETHALSRRLGRRLHLIAESDLGDVRVVTGREQGGLGLDSQWADDFHHAVHAYLTGERDGYYRDFGRLGQLAKAYRAALVYTWEYSPARDRRHGSDTKGISAERFVVCGQNHDQVGNRMLGERLSSLVSFEQAKLAAACVLLSPFVPLLFMGEEYAEPAPFLYFVSHADPSLVEAVRRGRQGELAAFSWEGEAPDPQDEGTFLRSKLRRELRQEGRHREMEEWYRSLLALRRATPALARLSKDDLEVAVDESQGLLLLWRWSGRSEAVATFNFSEAGQDVRLPIEGTWTRALDSEDAAFGGSGASVPAPVDAAEALSLKPRSVVVLTRSRGSRS